MIEKLRGAVWLDGRMEYAGVTPRISDLGLSVYQLDSAGGQIATEGPHFSFQMPIFFMTSIPESALATGAAYKFSGPGIGSVWMLNGYPAADLGSKTRLVTEYSICVSIKQLAVHIAIDGAAGPIEPWSISTPDPKAPQTLNFKIDFLMPENNFSQVLIYKNTADVFTKRFKTALGMLSHA